MIVTPSLRMSLSKPSFLSNTHFKRTHYRLDTVPLSGLAPVSPLQTLCGSDQSPGKSSTQKIHLRSYRLSLRQTMINRKYIWSLRSKVASPSMAETADILYSSFLLRVKAAEITPSSKLLIHTSQHD
jgi:hypothetical protein